MRPLPLTSRVSIAVALALAAAVVAGGALVYGDMKEILAGQVDRNLASLAKAVTAVMNDAMTPSAESAELQAVVGVSRDRRSSFCRIWIPQSSQDLYAGGLADKQAALDELLKPKLPPGPGENTFFDFGPGENRYRVVWTTAAMPEGPVNILIGQSVQTLDDELGEILDTFVAVGGGVVIASLVVVVFLVRWGLSPIRKTASELVGVTAANVGSVRLDRTAAPSELRPFVDSANGMLARLNDALEKQKAFVSDASHELRTPVALAKSTVQLALSSKRAPVDYERSLAEVLEDLRRMEHLVEELLTLARIDEGTDAVNRSEVELDVLLGKLADIYSPSASREGGQIVCCLRPTRVWGNENQLSRLFANLIDNAVKHGPKGGKITISIQDEDPNQTSVAVTDEGGRIPEDVLPHLFDRFYRADPSRAHSTGGAGLGLAIAREIALRHGGEISINSDARAGTCFQVRLPAGQARH